MSTRFEHGKAQAPNCWQPSCSSLESKNKANMRKRRRRRWEEEVGFWWCLWALNHAVPEIRHIPKLLNKGNLWIFSFFLSMIWSCFILLIPGRWYLQEKVIKVFKSSQSHGEHSEMSPWWFSESCFDERAVQGANGRWGHRDCAGRQFWG